MMKYTFGIVMVIAAHLTMAQKVVSTKGTTAFFSSASFEDITATNKKGKSVVNFSTGEIAFSIPIKAFQFERSLMQEHFNEKYMESELFPTATFSGVIMDWENEKSLSETMAQGKMTIHGVTKEMSASGSVLFKKNKLIIKAKFNIKLEDYGVEIPSIMFQKIAEIVEVNLTYEYPINEN